MAGHLDTDTLTIWGGVISFSLAGIFHLKHRAHIDDLQGLEQVTEVRSGNDLIELYESCALGTTLPVIAARGPIFSEEPLSCKLCDLKAVIRYVTEVHNRRNYTMNIGWLPERKLARSHVECANFSLGDPDASVQLPVMLGERFNVKDAMTVGGWSKSLLPGSLARVALDALFGSYTTSVDVTEHVLPLGKEVTAIGGMAIAQLKTDWQRRGNIRLKSGASLVIRDPPGGHLRFSRRSLQDLIHNVQHEARFCKLCSTVCGVVGGLIVGGRIVRYGWGRIKLSRRRRALEHFREENRDRLANMPEDGPKCCCCWERPPEMFFRGCGHASVCRDCSQSVGRRCPICRNRSDCLPLYF